MIIVKNIRDLKSILDAGRQKGLKTGFVPTMGALHEGHIELIREARKKTGLVVSSIFVNPTQFNDPGDFEKYPVTLEADISRLEEAGNDVLFLPSVRELYPDGTAALEHYDLGYLEKLLEGAFRPGHFQGVCQVMFRLLSAVSPDELFMGQKDYQQCMVVAHLLELMNSNTVLVTCPTVREKDGLAMSSRNKRLSSHQRELAVGIFKTLQLLDESLTKGDLTEIKKQASALLTRYEFRIDYIELADQKTLELVSQWDGVQPLVALVAAFQGEVRLIDNMLMKQRQPAN